MLVCFIFVGTQDRILIDINYHQITMNQHKNWAWKLNIDIYKLTFLLYQLLIVLNRFVIYLFLDKEIAKKKKFITAGGSWLFFISLGWWIGNEQLFNVGLINFYSPWKHKKTHPLKSFENHGISDGFKENRS